MTRIEYAIPNYETMCVETKEYLLDLVRKDMNKTENRYCTIAMRALDRTVAKNIGYHHGMYFCPSCGGAYGVNNIQENCTIFCQWCGQNLKGCGV